MSHANDIPTVPPPPPLPASVRKELMRTFGTDQVQKARKALADMAYSCPDSKVRKEAAQYIDTVARQEEQAYYCGSPDALIQLAELPVAARVSAAMQLFARGDINRTDLDTILKAVQTDQAARISELEKDKQALERENRDLDAQVRGVAPPPTIEGRPN